MLAGSISYFFVTAFFPFCLLLVSILGYLLGENREFYDFLLEKLMDFFPEATSGISRTLESLITYKRLGLLTLIIYGFFSYQLYQSLEKAINAIFKERSARPFLSSIIFSLFVITLIIALLIVSFSATSIISMLEFLNKFFPGLIINQLIRILIGFIIPLLLMSLAATSLYILLPKKSVMIRHALIGGVFTTLFLEAAKHVFTFYVAWQLSRLGAIYGSLSAFVIFILWVFYSVSIFLIGGEVVHNLGVLRKR